MCPYSVTECASYVERTVWDGNQLLYEIRTPTGTPTQDQPAFGSYHAFGRVACLHGGGIDAPLAVTRMDLSGQPAEVTVAPHADWQGQYVGASLMNGASQATCTGASGCPLVEWQGGKMTTDGVVIAAPSVQAWWGSLLQNQVSGSGLKYQRNRFYDPSTGQFTQADPIGLAGGANLYAFAGGDPVNFADPFGLCPECRMGWGSPTAEKAEREARYYEQLTNRDRAGMAIMGGAAVFGGVGIMAASKALLVAPTILRFAPVGVTVGKSTERLIQNVAAAGRSMDARVDAVSAWLPQGQKALMTPLEGGARMLSGGGGERARQVILQPNGQSIIKGQNMIRGGFDELARIFPYKD